MKKILTITLALTLIFLFSNTDEIYAKKKAKTASTECKFIDKNKDGKCDKFVDKDNNGKCDKCGNTCDGTEASCKSTGCSSKATVTGTCSSKVGMKGCSSTPGKSCCPSATKVCTYVDDNKDKKCDNCNMTESKHKAAGCSGHK